MHPILSPAAWPSLHTQVYVAVWTIQQRIQNKTGSGPVHDGAPFFFFLAPEKYGAVTKPAAVVLVAQDPIAEINSVKGKGGVLSGGGGETKIVFCIPYNVSMRRSPLR